MLKDIKAILLFYFVGFAVDCLELNLNSFCALTISKNNLTTEQYEFFFNYMCVFFLDSKGKCHITLIYLIYIVVTYVLFLSLSDRLFERYN